MPGRPVMVTELCVTIRRISLYHGFPFRLYFAGCCNRRRTLVQRMNT